MVLEAGTKPSEDNLYVIISSDNFSRITCSEFRKSRPVSIIFSTLNESKLLKFIVLTNSEKGLLLTQELEHRTKTNAAIMDLIILYFMYKYSIPNKNTHIGI